MAQKDVPDSPIVLRLKAAEVQALLDGQPLLLKILPPKELGPAARRKARQQEMAKERQAAHLERDIDRLIAAWNSSPVVAQAQRKGENRNKAFPRWRRKNDVARRRFSKALEHLGVEELLEQMRVYFAACQRGEHLRKDKNIGYIYVDGFADRLATADRKETKLWWQRGRGRPVRIKDSDPSATKQVADAYAGRFLGREHYGLLKNPSSEYERFKAAADRLRFYVERTGMEAGRALRLLLDCVGEAWPDRAYPGHLSSDHTWKTLLPQYVRRTYGKDSS